MEFKSLDDSIREYIFNILEGIKLLVSEKDNKDIDECIDYLSSFYKTTGECIFMLDSLGDIINSSAKNKIDYDHSEEELNTLKYYINKGIEAEIKESRHYDDPYYINEHKGKYFI